MSRPIAKPPPYAREAGATLLAAVQTADLRLQGSAAPGLAGTAAATGTGATTPAGPVTTAVTEAATAAATAPPPAGPAGRSCRTWGACCYGASSSASATSTSASRCVAAAFFRPWLADKLIAPCIQPSASEHTQTPLRSSP